MTNDEFLAVLPPPHDQLREAEYSSSLAELQLQVRTERSEMASPAGDLSLLSSPHRAPGQTPIVARARGPDGRLGVGCPVSVVRPPNHHTLPPDYKHSASPHSVASSPSAFLSWPTSSRRRRQERRRHNDDDGASSAATAAGTAAGVRGHHAHQGVRGRPGVGDPRGRPPRALPALRRHPRGRHHLRQAHRPLQGLRLRDVQGGGRSQEGVRGCHPRHQRPSRQLQPRLPRRQAEAPAAAARPPSLAPARARASLSSPAHASHRGGIQERVAGAMVLPPLHDAPSAAAGRAPAVPRRAPVLPRRRHLRVLPELRHGPELQYEGRPSGSCRHGGRVLPTATGALGVPGGASSGRHGAGVPVLPLPVPRLALAGPGRPRRALPPPGLRRRRRLLQAHRRGHSQSGVERVTGCS
uniref:Uncharacterized protein n=1 Tax=Zea mays TaxID=4577 RepID=A0A804UK35_MAIZE